MSSLSWGSRQVTGVFLVFLCMLSLIAGTALLSAIETSTGASLGGSNLEAGGLSDSQSGDRGQATDSDSSTSPKSALDSGSGSAARPETSASGTPTGVLGWLTALLGGLLGNSGGQPGGGSGSGPMAAPGQGSGGTPSAVDTGSGVGVGSSGATESAGAGGSGASGAGGSGAVGSTGVGAAGSAGLGVAGLAALVAIVFYRDRLRRVARALYQSVVRLARVPAAVLTAIRDALQEAIARLLDRDPLGAVKHLIREWLRSIAALVTLPARLFALFRPSTNANASDSGDGRVKTETVGPVAARGSEAVAVREAFRRVRETVPSRTATLTPGEIAQRAVSEGLPADAVGTIVTAFRDVMYGRRDPGGVSEAVTVAARDVERATTTHASEDDR